MMKKILLVSITLMLAGCASAPEWTGLKNPYTIGYKDHDPCIKCGEGWSFIPNERFAAQKSADR
jgi:hypothetical protein